MNRMLDEMTKEQLLSDFKVVIADAEALLKVTAVHGGEEFAEVRANAEASLNKFRKQLASAQHLWLERTNQAAKATDEYLHDNPWSAVGVAAGIGFMVGMLSGRR